MNRRFLTRRNIVVASSILGVAFAFACYIALRRPPRVDMERYVPAETLAFAEVASLTDLMEDLTSTQAWRELAPELGLSSQIRRVAYAADLIGRSGLGPDEVVVAGRAQLAVALTGVEAAARTTDEGAYLDLKPHIAFLIETHSTSETASRLVAERAGILARRVYGADAQQSIEEYDGTSVVVFRRPGTDRQLIAASSGSVILVGNHPVPVIRCLDAINSREPSLADSFEFRKHREFIDRGASVFAYVSSAGIEQLAELVPALIASGANEGDGGDSSISSLLRHISKVTSEGLLYSLRIDSGAVVERYLTLLRPGVAEALEGALTPASSEAPRLLHFVPNEADQFTLITVENAGKLPERLLKQLSPRVDTVSILALRQFVEDLFADLELDPGDPAVEAVGDEIAVVSLSGSQPAAIIISIRDERPLIPAVARYLSRSGETVSTYRHGVDEVMVSSQADGRGAVFTNGCLILGTRNQIDRILDAGKQGANLATKPGFRKVIEGRSSSVVITRGEPRATGAAETMLAIAKLTRVSDGSAQVLERESIRAAIDRLPPSINSTEFRHYGILTETRSAVGGFSLLSLFVGSDEEGEYE